VTKAEVDRLVAIQKTLEGLAAGQAKLEAKVTALEDRLERHVDPPAYRPPPPRPHIDLTAGMSMPKEAMADFNNPDIANEMRIAIQELRKR
jgi:ribosomal protein S12 methylthiotransferase accessory factor YcaO